MHIGTSDSERAVTSRRRAWFMLTVGVGLMVVALLGMILVIRGRQAGAPRVVVDRDVIDLGNQTYGTMVRAEFEVSNAGQGNLEFASPPEIEVVEGC